jgi:hypothetical protein
MLHRRLDARFHLADHLIRRDGKGRAGLQPSLRNTPIVPPAKRVDAIGSPECQDAAGVELGATAFGGWVPSDLRRFLPLAVLRTCLAEMVLLPTRFFFASAMSIL